MSRTRLRARSSFRWPCTFCPALAAAFPALLAFRPRITTLGRCRTFPTTCRSSTRSPCRAGCPGAPQRRAVGHRRARHGRARTATTSAPRLSEGPEPRAAPRRRDHRRAGPGAGRRRHRQDARAHHPHRPHPRHRPRLPLADPRRHLHQQGGARDEAAHRHAGRRGSVEGMPWLGTFHSIGVKLLRRHAELAGLRSDFTILDTDDQVRLIKQLIQAEDLDDKRWPARAVRHDDRRLEEQGPRPRRDPRRRRPQLRQRQGPRALRRLPGAAEDAQRLRFRRPAAATRSASSASNPDVLEGLPPQVQIHPRRRVPGHQHRPVHVAAAAGAAAGGSAPSPPCGGGCPAEGRKPRPGVGMQPVGDRPRATGQRPLKARNGQCANDLAKSTSAASATTTSRSTAGAAPRSTTSCASRRIFRAPPSSGSSATTARPPTSSAPPPTSSPTMRAASARRCSPTATTPRTPRSSSTPPGIPRRRRAPSARRSSSAQRRRPQPQRHGDPGARLLPDARVRGPLRHARPQLPRHRRPALLRAPGNPRRAGLSSASSRKPPTTSPSSASSTCRSAASANPPSARSTTPPARCACRCWRPPPSSPRPTS